MGYNIAIDGPAGAGKSTIAKLLAEKKGYVYVDTGALYRALAIHFISRKLEAEDREGIVESLKDAEVSIRYHNGIQKVYLNGQDITSLLREEEVGNMASLTSAIPEVREKLLDLQRELAGGQDVVMDGRDIGTNVLPNADVKVFLTANSRTRAKRRYDELKAKGQDCDIDKIEQDIIERDERDLNRTVAPLKLARDAVRIDSSDMTVAQVVEEILKLCR